MGSDESHGVHALQVLAAGLAKHLQTRSQLTGDWQPPASSSPPQAVMPKAPPEWQPPTDPSGPTAPPEFTPPRDPGEQPLACSSLLPLLSCLACS